MTNIAQMMQKAQEMKQKMAEMQQKVMDMDIKGEAGAGMVNVVMNGKGELRSIKIEPGIVNPEEVELLEDLVMAAVNDGRKKAEEIVAQETAKIMEEMGLPSNLDMPF